MPTARDMRAAAWGRMKEGGLLPLLAGFALVFLLSSLADNLLAWYGAQRGWIAQVPALDVADEMGLALAPEHERFLESVTIPMVAPAYRLATILFSAAWTNGILAFGCAVLAISAQRGRATAFQALSGFRWPFRTGMAGILRTLLIALWSLLLVVPGICAAYSYRMAFYLLADNPEWSPGRALRESRQLMQGHRWRLACLDVSFIGWFLLVAVTAGLAGIFVLPYFATANAAFYEDLLDRAGR